MRKVLPLFLIFVVFFACRSTYNEEAVKKLIEQPEIKAWTDTFVNNSNLVTQRNFRVMVVSSKDLPQREVRAIKNYLKNKHDTEEVIYHYRPNAYQ